MGGIVNGGGGKEKATWQCLSTPAIFGLTGAEGSIYFAFVFLITKLLWLSGLERLSYRGG